MCVRVNLSVCYANIVSLSSSLSRSSGQIIVHARRLVKWQELFVIHLFRQIMTRYPSAQPQFGKRQRGRACALISNNLAGNMKIFGFYFAYIIPTGSSAAGFLICSFIDAHDANKLSCCYWLVNAWLLNVCRLRVCSLLNVKRGEATEINIEEGSGFCRLLLKPTIWIHGIQKWLPSLFNKYYYNPS